MTTPKLPKLDLNVTNSCNYRCAHCAFSSGKATKELSLSKIEQILDETKDLGGQRIDITGGEPTMRRDLPAILQNTTGKGYKVELVTNGSLLNQALLRDYQERGLHQIAISIDGTNFLSQQYLRKNTLVQYNRTLQTLDESIKLGIITKINTVVGNHNITELACMVDYAKEKRVSELGFYCFTPVGRGNAVASEMLDPVVWLETLHKLAQLSYGALKVSVEVLALSRQDSKQAECLILSDRNHLHILPSGDVYPCALLVSQLPPLGNVCGSSMQDLWQNDAVWNLYADKVKHLMHTQGSCVPYLKLPKNQEYRFACPLRKYPLKEFL